MSLFLLQDWANKTNVHPLALVFALASGYAILVLPRGWVPLVLVALACFIPAGQRVVVMTLDFSFLRMLLLFGWLRLALRREHVGLRFRALDLVLVAWALVMLTTFSLQRGTVTALIFKLGVTFDAIGLYFLFRCLVPTWPDLDRVSLALTIVAVPVCLAFWIERSTGRNLFSVFGGVPEFTSLREGRLRCQGAYLHSILAGSFWAAALGLIGARWWSGGWNRHQAVVGTLSALSIIALTASSTPIMASCFAVLAAAAFPVRRYLRVGRIALVIGLAGLHLLMNAPVWHLVARVNVVGGSTGWHRFYLIDEAIKHFDEWWLMGTPSTRHWGLGLEDVTNQYVLQAVHGGLLGLILFLSLIVLGFQAVGRAWRAAWPERARVAMVWALGVSLFSQCVSFLGVAYFDQTEMIWYLVLGCLASFGTPRAHPRDHAADPRAARRTRQPSPRQTQLASGSSVHSQGLSPWA